MSRLEFFDMIGAPRLNTKRIQRAERKRKIAAWNLKTKEIFYTLLTTHLPIYSACLFPILISLHPNSPPSSRPSLCLPPYILALSLPSLVATQLSCYRPSLFSLRQFPIHYLHPPFHLLLLSLPPYFLALSFPSVFDITYQLYFSVNAFSYSIS